ncbi:MULTISPECIES: DNA glycosylase AlkZ-like family protein [Streptomyces]|uniref:Winged helix DNA-binding domain-containing protein n=1 Tax=Streptomyces aidingensis TaxID=910347 RepID=A0A1I1SB59_9ACTN|nr:MULTISPECIES: crosslink repair DNA glycosylase YcaQ family protein [Streptomyces]SFD43754.1 Winged helix DNA-binding domain-containing protein [Streptomyces aidingensis]
MTPVPVLPAAVERAAVANRHGWGTGPAPRDLPGLAGAQAGLHAARLLTPYVTAYSRFAGTFSPAQLRQALAPGGTLLKVRCMRRTLHLWPLDQAADAHTASLRLRLGATAATGRRHGLTGKDLRLWADRAREALAGGPLGYRDLTARLAKQNPAAGIEAARLGIKWAWEAGHLTCRNTASSLHREQRQFALLEHFHPGLTLNATEPATATVALVRRYLRAYGPAAESDLLWWSGLTRSEITPALAAIRREITPVRVAGLPETLLVLSEDLDRIRATPPLPHDHVRLLAFEDPTCKGYFTTRARYHDPAHTARAFNPIGEVRAAITVAGRIVGTWSWEKRTRTVHAEFFSRLPRRIAATARRQLEAAQEFLRTEPS